MTRLISKDWPSVFAVTAQRLTRLRVYPIAPDARVDPGFDSSPEGQ